MKKRTRGKRDVDVGQESLTHRPLSGKWGYAGRPMTEDLVIKNGLVVTPQGIMRGGLAIRGEKIVQLASDELLPKASLEIDAGGCYVLPGIIDPHIHLGGTKEESTIADFRTETTSAAISGVTMIIAYFGFGDPLAPRLAYYKRAKEMGKQNSFIDFKFHAYLFNDIHLKEMPDVIKEGVTSAKLLLGSNEEEAKRSGRHAIGLDYAYRLMDILSVYGPPVFVQAHCEHPDIISVFTKELKAKGRNDFLAWVESRPPICEAIHAYSLGLMSLKTGCPLYIVHVSAKETITAIKHLRQLGAKIYAETCPHYLTLTKNTPMGLLAKMAPPLREETDMDCLWRAVSDGTIDLIGSDHCLRWRRDREEVEAWQGIPGIGGIGAILPLLMTEGVHKGRMTIEQMVKLTSENAARIWGIYPRKGVLSPGSDADIVIVDPNKEWVMSANNLKSASDYSVYEGRVVKGKAIKTFVRGKLVAEEGELVTKTPVGEFIHPL